VSDDEPTWKLRKKGRGWSSARAALKLGRVAARGFTGRSSEDLARALGEQLDGMKGLAMKIGQILSYMDTPLPDELREQLGGLQTGMSHRPWSEVSAQLEAEFGMPASEAFDAVDDQPIAAASIGQVHRGRFEGRPVAIKIRHPGIEETFQGDTDALRSVAGLASMASSVDGVGIIDEMAARLAEECDYRREARAQQAFARAFADDATIYIPAVVASRSTDAVLTSEWCDGDDFATLQASTEQRRRATACTMVRMAYRSLFVHGAIQADPHPGNYIFQDDRVVFLDFGCVRLFSLDYVEAHRELARCVLEGRRTGFPEALMATGAVGRERGFDYDHEWRVQRHTWAPFLASGFHFTRAFLVEGNDLYGPTAPNARSRAIPPPGMWILRLVWGLYAVLQRLEVELDLGPILRTILTETPSPLHLEE